MKPVRGFISVYGKLNRLMARDKRAGQGKYRLWDPRERLDYRRRKWNQIQTKDPRGTTGWWKTIELRKLPSKEKNMLRLILVEGFHKFAAYKASYLKPYMQNDSAEIRANEIVKKSNPQAAMKEWLEAEGITKEFLVTIMKEGLGAKKTATFEGLVTVSEEADHSVRLNFAKLAFDLMGETKKKPGSKPKNSLTVKIQAHQGMENQVKELLLEQLKGSVVSQEEDNEVMIEEELI